MSGYTSATSTILNNFNTAIKRQYHSKATLNSVLNSFKNQAYFTSQTALYISGSNANKQAKKTPYFAATSESSTSCYFPTQCSHNSSDSNQCDSEDMCHMSGCLICGLSTGGSGHDTTYALNNVTYFLYADPTNSSANNQGCMIGSLVYAMGFENCVMMGTSKSSSSTIKEYLLNYMCWYWQIHTSSKLIICSQAPSTYSKIIYGPTVVNTTIQLESGSSSDNCHYPPTQSPNYKKAVGNKTNCSQEYSFPQNPASTNYACMSCCYNYNTSNNQKCAAYITYYIYYQNDFNDETSCWYNQYYQLFLQNMVISWENSSSMLKNIMKWVFWYNGISSTLIDKFTIQTTEPSSGVIVNSYSMAGFGISNIEKSSTSNCYVVTDDTYFSIPNSPGKVGYTTTPRYACSGTNGLTCPVPTAINCTTSWNSAMAPTNSNSTCKSGTYYIYNTKQFSKYGKCWYQVCYKLTLTNMAIAWESGGGWGNTLKRWIFWHNGLVNGTDTSGATLDISDFNVSQNNPGGTVISSHQMSGFGVGPINESTSTFCFIVDSSSYFAYYGLSTQTGYTLTPKYNKCTTCPYPSSYY